MAAAQACGIGWRRAYVWCAEDSEFRAAWDTACAQAKARPVVMPYPVPATPPSAPPVPFEIPPSPPRVAPAPRVFLVTVPGHEYTGLRPKLAAGGDKVVTLLLRDAAEPEVITYTIEENGR